MESLFFLLSVLPRPRVERHLSQVKTYASFGVHPYPTLSGLGGIFFDIETENYTRPFPSLIDDLGSIGVVSSTGDSLLMSRHGPPPLFFHPPWSEGVTPPRTLSIFFSFLFSLLVPLPRSAGPFFSWVVKQRGLLRKYSGSLVGGDTSLLFLRRLLPPQE